MPQSLIPHAPRPTRSGGRVTVGWELPAGVRSLLGTRQSGGLTWLLGVRYPADALALLLKRALAIDAHEVIQ
jgi:hypothetical protein